MIMECEYCQVLVEAEILYEYSVFIDEIGEPFNSIFLKCPKCESAMLASQEISFIDDEGDVIWDSPRRLYPTEKEVNYKFPKIIRQPLEEVYKSFKAKAYMSSAIMCRKTLEAVCQDHGINKRFKLGRALIEMKKRKFIEEQLFNWATVLRITGNEAAHDVAVNISRDDAKDLLEFTEAFLNYIYTFKDKFNSFKKRRNIK